MFLKGKDAKKFIEQDKKPLSSKQKKYLERCKKIYEKNPIVKEKWEEKNR